jgi:hypothetical protein
MKLTTSTLARAGRKSTQHWRSRERRRAQRQGCQIRQRLYEHIQCYARDHQARTGPWRKLTNSLIESELVESIDSSG